MNKKKINDINSKVWPKLNIPGNEIEKTKKSELTSQQCYLSQKFGCIFFIQLNVGLYRSPAQAPAEIRLFS